MIYDKYVKQAYEEKFNTQKYEESILFGTFCIIIDRAIELVIQSLQGDKQSKGKDK